MRPHTDPAVRASREKVFLRLRDWAEKHGVSRRELAETFGITCGHLSTLLNVNRTPSHPQVLLAQKLMGEDAPIDLLVPTSSSRHSSWPEPKPKRKREKRAATPKVELRPLTEFEIKFVTEVAMAWIKTNKDSTQDDLVNVIRALSIGIRS